MFETILQHPIRVALAGLGLTAALSCASEDDVTEPEPFGFALEILPKSLNILQGETADFTVTVTRNGVFTGAVDLTVTGTPVGVTGMVSEVQTTGTMTTATMTIVVHEAARPGHFSLVVRGAAPGVVPATALLTLVVAEKLLPCPVTGLCAQWAVEATASTQYTSTEWSAMQATGSPDMVACTDDPRAWASVEPNGVDWLELTYATSVRPTEIQVYEVYGVSSIVKVEVGDGTGTYHTVYTAQPALLTCPRILIIPVTGISTAMRVVRLSVDQRTLQGWNEIDAVKLIGSR